MPNFLQILSVFFLFIFHIQGEFKYPNILLIYADDLGYGDLGCYNKNSKIPTPNLDKLAKEGMLFTDGHSSSGICTPSRYALLTGRHHWRKFHGIVGAFGKSVFSKDRLTIPGMLKEKGYSTGAIGKWHLGFNWDAIRNKKIEPKFITKRTKKGEKKIPFFGPEHFDWDKPIPDGPLDHGFDNYFGDAVINFPPYCWIENNKVAKAPDTIMDTSKWKQIKEGKWECRPGPMASDWDPYKNIPTITMKGIEFIKSQSKKPQPYFLYFAFPSPHAPIIPNDEFDNKSKAGPYGDLVYEMDNSIGKLLKAVKDSGEADNTLIIFSADNGPEKYAYVRSQKFNHWSAYPLRGLKRDMYEGGHRVPLIIKWKGKVKGGKKTTVLVSQIDLFATIATIVDFSLPADQAEDSYDLLNLITGKTKKSPRDIHIHNTKKGIYSIRSGDWLYVDYKNGYHSGRNQDWEKKYVYKSDDDPKGQLFNLKKDLGQRNNIASKYPEKVKELKSLLKKIQDQGHSAPRLN